MFVPCFESLQCAVGQSTSYPPDRVGINNWLASALFRQIRLNLSPKGYSLH